MADIIDFMKKAAGVAAGAGVKVPEVLGGRVSELVESITIETAWGPTITIDPRTPSVPVTGPGAGELMAKLLKPKVTVRVRGIGQPLVAAPYGEPGPTRWPLVQLGAFGLGFLTVLGGVQVARKLTGR